MKQICHAHCPKGGGSAASLLIGALVVIGFALGTTSTAARIASDLLDGVLWTLGSVAGLSVITISLVVIQRRRRGPSVHGLPACHPPVRLVRSRRVAELGRPRQAIDGVAVSRDEAVR